MVSQCHQKSMTQRDRSRVYQQARRRIATERRSGGTISRREGPQIFGDLRDQPHASGEGSLDRDPAYTRRGRSCTPDRRSAFPTVVRSIWKRSPIAESDRPLAYSTAASVTSAVVSLETDRRREPPCRSKWARTVVRWMESAVATTMSRNGRPLALSRAYWSNPESDLHRYQSDEQSAPPRTRS